jgi:hypothetical protein
VDTRLRVGCPRAVGMREQQVAAEQEGLIKRFDAPLG